MQRSESSTIQMNSMNILSLGLTSCHPLLTGKWYPESRWNWYCPVGVCRRSFSSLFDQQRKTIVHLFSRRFRYWWNSCFNLLTCKIHKWLFWKQKEISMAINFWKQFRRVEASPQMVLLSIDAWTEEGRMCVVRCWILSNNGRCTLCVIPLSLRLHQGRTRRGSSLPYYVVCDLWFTFPG